MNTVNLAKLFSISVILIVFVFLINNYLTFGGDWPGAFSIKNDLNIYSSIQFSLYLFAIFLSIFFVFFYKKNLSLIKIADFFENTNGYIIRSAFWGVFIIGIVDALISLLIIEGFIEYFFGKSWNVKFSNNSFRAPFVHFPLLLIALVLGYFFKSLNFFWLAFLVVLAEFQIVLLRFVFSYEQTLMSDLVRFWYGSLFLFASYYTLIKDGHVRVDVLYTNFTEKNKALVNLIGSLILGIPLCLTIFLKGMSCKQCVLNQPIMNFETSQSTQGMNIKYLMAGFLIIFALTMLIQFVVYFLRNLEIIKRK